MKASVSIIGSLAIASVVFVTGAATAVWRNWGQAVATVEVVNASGEKVRHFEVEFATCGLKGSVNGGALAPGASKQVTYALCGEGGQLVRAYFEDGKAVTDTGAYVQTGQRVRVRILKDRIAP